MARPAAIRIARLHQVRPTTTENARATSRPAITLTTRWSALRIVWYMVTWTMSAVSGASTLRAPVGARRPSEQAHVAVMLSRAIGAAMGCALWRTGVSVAGAACTMARTADPPDSPASRQQVRLLAVQRERAGIYGSGCRLARG